MIRYLTDLSLDVFVEAARNIPYQQVHSDLFPGIDLWIRRDDLIDPLISGNKAYKLLFNLLEARDQGKDTIITCGGAWSNHIHATAAAGQRFGFKTIGIIRGERPPVLSAMLQDAERFGMALRFVSRSLYRERHSQDFLQRVGLGGENAWFVPEGGANLQGARGGQLLGKVIRETEPHPFSEYWLPCGTGVTIGSFASALPADATVCGVPVLKAEAAIQREAIEWRQRLSANMHGVIKIMAGGHCGGYGKVNQALLRFMSQFARQARVPLDAIYGAKAAFLLSQIASEPRDRFTSGENKTKILLIHTGGVQGNRGITIKI